VTQESTAAAVQAALDVDVRALEPLSGGCISPVYRAALADGREVAVKAGDPGGGLDLEAWMLERLGAAGWPVPAVLHAQAALLVLEYVDSDGGDGEAGQRHAAELLARLHGRAEPHFGLERDTVIAGLPQRNEPAERWVPFFVEQRLLAMASQAREAGRLAADLHRRIEALVPLLESRLQEPDHPALIHGDLWSGNLLFRHDRLAAVIDPACYCADPEIELAFSTLFHSFGDSFFARYAELRPIAPGFFEERRDLYNLYPLLVHLRLFGAGYAGAIDRTLRRFGV
jgi:fructosamine-3-kinase